MSSTTKKWLEVLESRFGVPTAFSEHLLPMLQKAEERNPSAAEWERLLSGIATAYREQAPSQDESVDEVRLLLSQFVTELKKLDETLKVLGVYLERVRERIKNPTVSRLLH